MPTYYTSTETVLALRAGYTTASFLEVAVGDFTGDGKADVVLSYFSFPFENRGIPIRLLAGNGAGGLSDITATAFPAGAPETVFSRQNVIADFNGDGRSDIFLGGHGIDINPFPGEHNGLMLSSGATGVVNASDRLPAISNNFTHSAAAADIDRDGDIDIFVNNSGNTPPYFLIGDGRGGFTRDDGRLPTALVDANRWDTVTFFDVDRDGDADMFLGTATAQRHANQLLLNDGSGRFSVAGVLPFPVTPEPLRDTQAVDSSAADINGDGWLDLIVHYTLYAPAGNAPGYTQVLINQRNNTFADETASRIPAAMNFVPFYNRVAVVDMNGDGYLDLLAARSTDTPLYLNDGTGRFVQMPKGTIPFQAFSSQYAGDFNGDGRMDLVADYGNFNSAEHFRVLLSVDAGLTQTGTAAADGLMGDNDGETMSGGAGDDVIFGGGGTNYLRGDDGADTIVGGRGFDDINGNMGNDSCLSGGGNDWVVGGKDNDTLVGSDGDNLVYGNLGADSCDGGGGNDIVRGGQDNDVVQGGAGDDFVSGDKGDDTMTGGAGADVFHTFGDAGLDRVTDFSLAQGDRVQLDPGTQFTVAQMGADTVITMVGGGQMILVGVQMSTLTPGWIFGA